MRRGFTLVELVMVVGITAMISAAVLANFPSFRSRIALDREAGKVALALRKAQQYSNGVRRFERANFVNDPVPQVCIDKYKREGLVDPAATLGATYEAQYPAYGLAVSTISDSRRHEYTIYADPNCDRLSANYPDPPADPNDDIEKGNLENGVSIERICVDVEKIADCSQDALTSIVTKLDIWYLRPGLASRDTIIITDGTFAESGINYARALILLQGPDGITKSVIVRNTGQISIQ